MAEQTDNRSLAELAREALVIQNACNLSGLVHGFARALSRLRALLPSAGTERINTHPIAQVWADKLASLAGVQCSVSWAPSAYRQVERWASGSERAERLEGVVS